MIRYSLLRFMIFFGCLALFWLLGLRSTNELPWLAVIAAISSMVISAIVLKPFRAQMIHDLEDRRAAKAERRAARTDSDEAVEDRAQDAKEKAAPVSEDEEEETFR
ncbi:MAG TPA: DUF4229 domain-containing protein [Candidatus Janibacter merdipullorum]|nr:DUF4229 domain-containing protein [Candidatus Janibacter merdipullorum]